MPVLNPLTFQLDGFPIIFGAVPYSASQAAPEEKKEPTLEAPQMSGVVCKVHVMKITRTIFHYSIYIYSILFAIS